MQILLVSTTEAAFPSLEFAEMPPIREADLFHFHMLSAVHLKILLCIFQEHVPPITDMSTAT